MVKFLNLLFDRIANWQLVSILIVLFILCIQGFNWRAKKLRQENEILDARFWYTPADAKEFFHHLGQEKRQFYALTQITLDLVFPLTYGILFSALIVRLYQENVALALGLVPLIGALTDVGENLTTAYLAISFNERESRLAWIAGVFTLIKLLLFVTSLLIILVGGAIGL